MESHDILALLDKKLENDKHEVSKVYLSIVSMGMVLGLLISYANLMSLCLGAAIGFFVSHESQWINFVQIGGRQIFRNVHKASKSD